MRVYDIIEKKRDGRELTDEEISFFVSGLVAGEIPDYQATALLMAIYLRGMNDRETIMLTLAMERSGDVVDLSAIPGIKVDKHSTGGVGDKTSLAVVPIVASLGVPVAKMSGRGLGHTGGTLDKLESIPGLTTALDRERFVNTVLEHGCAIVGQTGNLVPADKIIYALRDVTATVSSVPLIASSIMSKKLAAGSDKILLDVKVGSGAFMQDLDSAIELAQTMVAIGEGAGRTTVALVTNMDRPLGHAIGNSLEVIEVVNTLCGNGPEDLEHECVALAAEMLVLAGRATTREEGATLAAGAIADGSAFAKLCEMIEAQGGDVSCLRDTSRFRRASVEHAVLADRSGYVTRLDTTAIGIASVELGAGRERLEDEIDPSAGITLLKNRGDAVEEGEVVALLYTSDESRLADALVTFTSAVHIALEPPVPEPIVLARVDAAGVCRFE